MRTQRVRSAGVMPSRVAGTRSGLTAACAPLTLTQGLRFGPAASLTRLGRRTVLTREMAAGRRPTCCGSRHGAEQPQYAPCAVPTTRGLALGIFVACLHGSGMVEEVLRKEKHLLE